MYGFRYNRFAAMKAKFHNGILVAEHGRTGRCEITDSSIRVISWLRTFSEKVGDRMPTSSAIHLPSCLTKADVYILAKDDLSQGDMECCSISTFYAILSKHFRHVKIPKVIGIFLINVMNQESVPCFIKNGVPTHSGYLKVGLLFFPIAKLFPVSCH